MPTLRAGIYCRISRDRVGAGLGVQRQEEDCRELAAGLDATVVAVHTDNDISAYSGKPRPGYKALISAVRAGEVNVVLCWHTDRLHRSPAELEEVEHMIEKQKRQKQQAATAGRYRGGRRPFGYESDGVTVRPAEAAIVAELTDRVLAGESLHSVTRDLNTRGVVTSTGGRWKTPELRRLLLRARNAGLIEHNGQEIGPAEWQPIVEPAAWRNLRRMLTAPDRRRDPRVAELRWLGSGLYRCGVCGDGTTMLSANASSGSSRAQSIPTYRCRAGSHLTRAAVPLDDYVSAVVIERLSRPDARLLLAPADRRVDLEVLHARRADLTAQLGEIGRDAVKQRIPLATVAAMTAEIETQLDELDRQLSASSVHSPLDGFADAEDVAEAWAVAGVGRRKAVIRELMTVTLVKAPRGRVAGWRPGQPYFNPRAVQIDWQPS